MAGSLLGPTRNPAAIVVFLHLLLSPLVFGRGFVESFEYPKAGLLLASAIALLCGALLSTPAVGPGLIMRGFPRGDLLARGVVLFLASAVASTVASISPRLSLFGAHESFAGLLTVASYAVLFFGTRALFRSAGEVRALLYAPVMAAGVVSAYAAAQLAGLDPFPWREVATIGAFVRPFSTLGHPNSMAAYLVMTLPLTLHFARAAAGAGRRLSGGLLLAIALSSGVAIVASLSRAAWLGLASSLLAFAVLSAQARSNGHRRRLLPAAAAALVGVCILAMPVFREALSARLGTLAAGGGRSFMWEASLELFRQRPLLGWGLDAFQIAFVRERPPEYWLVEWSATPGKAHNEALHVLATQGVVGAAAAVVLLAGVAFAARRAWRRVAPEERTLIAAIVASLVGFMVPLLFGFAVLATSTLFVTLAAALSAREADAPAERATPRAPDPSSSGHRVLLVPMAVAALAAYLAVGRPARAAWACKTGDGHLRGGRTEEAARAFRRAVRLDSVRDLYWVRLGTALEAEAGRQIDPARQRAPLVAALEAFEQAERRVPANPYNRNNVARILGRLAALGAASMSDAYAAFEDALALDPNNAYFLVEAADAATTAGDLARARGYAEKTASLYPRFAAPYLQLARLATLEGRTDEALALFRRSAQAEWFGDAAGEAQSAAELALALVRKGLFAEAQGAARTALERSPWHPMARLALARAAAGLGDAVGARREYHELLRLRPDFAPARRELQSLEGR